MKKLINAILITAIGFTLAGCGASVSATDVMTVKVKKESMKSGHFTYTISVPESPNIYLTSAQSFEVGKPIYFTQEK